jgi:hypothetical protein
MKDRAQVLSVPEARRRERRKAEYCWRALNFPSMARVGGLCGVSHRNRKFKLKLPTTGSTPIKSIIGAWKRSKWTVSIERAPTWRHRSAVENSNFLIGLYVITIQRATNKLNYFRVPQLKVTNRASWPSHASGHHRNLYWKCLLNHKTHTHKREDQKYLKIDLEANASPQRKAGDNW